MKLKTKDLSRLAYLKAMEATKFIDKKAPVISRMGERLGIAMESLIGKAYIQYQIFSRTPTYAKIRHAAKPFILTGKDTMKSASTFAKNFGKPLANKIETSVVPPAYRMSRDKYREYKGSQSQLGEFRSDGVNIASNVTMALLIGSVIYIVIFPLMFNQSMEQKRKDLEKNIHEPI